jgi:putative Mg2+ transporter-C (MgtC) family protein
MLSEADLIVLGRAALAAVLGLLIGWERQALGSAIRARTIGLAALTAASLTALGHEIFATGTDRVVQGIVTGIGFLGAGVIIHGASGEVRGLTTAASMWAMTAIGVAVGSGHEVLGILLAALIYVIIALGEWPILALLRRRPSRGTMPPPVGQARGESSSGRMRDSTAERSEPSGECERPNAAGSDARRGAASDTGHAVGDGERSQL